jgi:hypothetical protein
VKFHKMRNFTGDDEEAANHVSAPPGVGDPDDQNAGHRSQPIADPDSVNSIVATKRVAPTWPRTATTNRLTRPSHRWSAP